MDLATLLGTNPGKTTDFRRDLSSPADFLRTVVAFANSSGGTVVVGVDPADRSVRGVADPLALEERVDRLVSDGVRPALALDQEILPWRQKVHLVAVRVHPGPHRPYHLRKGGLERGVFVRSGARDRLADPEMVEDLKRQALGGAYDEEPCAGAGPEDLDGEALERAFRRAGRPAPGRDDLRALHLLTEHEGRTVPTRGGLLLFGRGRLERFPDAWIQAGRFAGNDRSSIEDAAEIQVALPLAVEEAMAFALRNLTRASRIEGLRRVDEHAVPPVALREALVNAVVHADYAQRGAPIRLAVHPDRVEVTNPGLLPPGLSLEDLDHGISKLRNRVFGRVFHRLKMVEQWGSGVARMKRAQEEAGLAPPVFEEIGLSFRVILGAAATAPPRADARDGAILDALAERGPLSTSQVAAIVGISDRAMRTRLRNLVDRGRVVEIGSGPNDPQRKYAVLNRP